MLLVSSIVYKLSPNARRRNVEAGAGLSTLFQASLIRDAPFLGQRKKRWGTTGARVPSEIKGSGFFPLCDNRDNRFMPVSVKLLFFPLIQVFLQVIPRPPRNLATIGTDARSVIDGDDPT